MTHPYQYQVNKMWEMIKRKNLAQANSFWLESLSLSYVLLEIELRLLLSSKAGDSSIPIPPEKINQQNYLMELANLAKSNGFIDEAMWNKIRDFNQYRSKAIHGLAQGDIEYDELKEPALNTTILLYDIQSCWLPIKFGEIEENPNK